MTNSTSSISELQTEIKILRGSLLAALRLGMTEAVNELRVLKKAKVIELTKLRFPNNEQWVS